MELLTSDVILPLKSISCKIREGNGYADRILLKKNKRLHQVLPEYLNSLLESMDGSPCKIEDVMKLLVPDY